MKLNTLPTDVYTTKDFDFISLFFALDLELDSYQWDDKSCYFSFRDKEKCEEIVRKYHRHELLINPRQLFRGMDEAKSLLFSSK